MLILSKCVFIHSSLRRVEPERRNCFGDVYCYFLEPKPTESTGQIPGKDGTPFEFFVEEMCWKTSYPQMDLEQYVISSQLSIF